MVVQYTRTHRLTLWKAFQIAPVEIPSAMQSHTLTYWKRDYPQPLLKRWHHLRTGSLKACWKSRSCAPPFSNLNGNVRMTAANISPSLFLYWYALKATKNNSLDSRALLSHYVHNSHIWSIHQWDQNEIYTQSSQSWNKIVALLDFIYATWTWLHFNTLYSYVTSPSKPEPLITNSWKGTVFKIKLKTNAVHFHTYVPKSTSAL